MRIAGIIANPGASNGRQYEAVLTDGRWVRLTRERYHRCNQGMHKRGL